MVELGVYESKVLVDRSFRTVIPKPVAKALKLERGSKLAWELRVEDREVFVIVRKATTSPGKIDSEPALSH
jgi:bifunctional DNA-binding transcriptional regulator/antitoxin component of YhaV-PrlF toxin-antitoxin module